MDMFISTVKAAGRMCCCSLKILRKKRDQTAPALPRPALLFQ
jgi:hypothetical protein